MKFNKHNLPKTREQLDQFVREHELIPYGVVEYEGREIFIAETDLVIEEVPSAECPLGYWQVAWFVNEKESHEKMELGRGIDFEARHDDDKNWTPETKRMARVNTAIADAQQWIDKEKVALDA